MLLYEVLQDRDICVNAWMVKEGKAVSISGSTMEYQKEIITVENTDVGVHKVSVSNASGQAGVKNVEKVACRVVSVESPSSIFIMQVMDEDSFQDLHRDMQDYYNSDTSDESNVKLEVGALYAVYVDGWAGKSSPGVEGRSRHA